MVQQLALPLGEPSRKEDPLRQAWVRSGIALPFELARQDRAISICLRCLAEAMRIRRGRRRHG